MTTPTFHIGELPASVIGDPKTYATVAGALVEVSGFEFGEAAAIRVISNVAFYFALAETDVEGAAKSAADATRGWRPAGANLLAFSAEIRKVYIRAISGGTMSIERLQAYTSIED